MEVVTDSWRYHSLIMIGIHTDRITLEVKSILAEFDMLQLIFMQVWPSPYSSINNMWKPFPSCHL